MAGDSGFRGGRNRGVGQETAGSNRARPRPIPIYFAIVGEEFGLIATMAVVPYLRIIRSRSRVRKAPNIYQFSWPRAAC